MGYGGYHPYPRRFGGGKPRAQTIHESLNQQRGDGVDTSKWSEVWIENLAYARALYWSGWESNRRLAMQWDPYRVTSMLERWERIFGIVPSPKATKVARRRALVKRWKRFGAKSNHSTLTALLASELGPFFVAVEYISLASANVHVPDNTYPWGTVVPGITWYSTIAHILVRLTKPDGASWSEFYDKAGSVVSIVDWLLPAWISLDWYRASSCGTPIDLTPDGPSGAGFYLDCPHNLDNQVFDV